MNISKIADNQLSDNDYEYLGDILLEQYGEYDVSFPIDLTIYVTKLKQKRRNEQGAYEPYLIILGQQLRQESIGYPKIMSFTFVQEWLMDEPYVIGKLLLKLEPKTEEYNRIQEYYVSILQKLIKLQAYFFKINDYYVTEESYL